MGRLDDIRKLKDSAANKLANTDLSKLAGDVALGAAGLVESAESVAKRSGLTNKHDEISKPKLIGAALRPRKTGRKLLGAVAEEVRAHRSLQDDLSPSRIDFESEEKEANPFTSETNTTSATPARPNPFG